MAPEGDEASDLGVARLKSWSLQVRRSPVLSDQGFFFAKRPDHYPKIARRCRPLEFGC